ncbi:MAG: GNAT family N-acetyltransferase [Spirulina sp.]
MITTALPLLIPRPEQGQSDLPALVAFYQACEQADPNDHAPTLEQLQRRMDHPPPGGRQHRQYWETADGQLVGVVTLWMSDPRTDIPPDPSPDSKTQDNPSPTPGTYPPVVNSHLGIMVHPHYRHQGLEATLLDWAEHYVQTTRPDPHIPVHLRVVIAQNRTEEQAVYEAHHFRKTRWFQTLQRPLSLALENPQMPPGFAIQRADTVSAEDWVALFNDTFIDHWHFVPMTVAQHQHHAKIPTYQPDLDWVAVADDGTLAGFCAAHIPHEENTRHQRREGSIALLGTRRGYRRQGLGRAMLLYGLQQLQEAGLDTALIGVDRDNPNHAKTLYESVGFQVKESWLNYTKVLT